MRGPGSIPMGVLMWNQDSPVNFVSLYWWPRRDWLLWPHLRRASSRTITRSSCWQCDNPMWSHTALCPGFTLAAGSPSGFITDTVSCWGGGSLFIVVVHLFCSLFDLSLRCLALFFVHSSKRKDSILILDCIPGILILLINNCTRCSCSSTSSSMQVNKHHTANCTDFVWI
jgi:hypothetical protein